MPRRLPQRPIEGVLHTQAPATLPEAEQIRTLLAEAQALSTRLAALNEVAVAMQSDLNTNEILQTFAREARWVIDYRLCLFVLRTDHGYSVQVLRGQAPSMASNHALGSDSISRVLRDGQALLINEANERDDLPNTMQSAILLPLRNAGNIVGTINFYTTTTNAYRLDDVRIAYALAVQVGVILQNARLLSDVTHARNELHTILESIRDAVVVTDLQGRVLLVNSSLQHLLHLTDTPQTDVHITTLLRTLRAKQRRVISANVLNMFRQQWPHGGNLRLGDGRTIEWAVAPLAENGLVIGHVVTARDISERVELEGLRDAMTGMLVHDLRTPLTSLMLSLDFLLLDNVQLETEDTIAILHQSRRSATRLMDLISTILDVRKLQAGKMELLIEPIVTNSLFAQAVTSVRGTLDQYGQQIAIEVADSSFFFGDKALMLRVIENLLGNAVKFSPQGSAITLGASGAPDQQIEFTIADHGPGVPETQREHIFEMFGQVRTSDAKRGTGLGLAFCKLVVEAHGGTIGVRSRADGGSVFWCRLPLAQPDSNIKRGS